VNPWKISAQFAAYVWFTNQHSSRKSAADEARRFAKENWVAFLPYADDGMGRLLIAVAKPPRKSCRSENKSRLERAKG
jgi:hypothetical protein